MKIHVVKKGETVLSIARQYGVSPGLLQRQNQVPPDGALVPGQTLVVQEVEKTHTVRSGDTVWSIARRYGITVRALYQNNIFLQGQGRLQPGEELVISYRAEGRPGPWGERVRLPLRKRRPAAPGAAVPDLCDPFTYGIGPEGEPV
ncbi:MAG: LysM peptidoglycan-binding domain-containing protein, partial [Oscillospiraceae bacterium]